MRSSFHRKEKESKKSASTRSTTKTLNLMRHVLLRCAIPQKRYCSARPTKYYGGASHTRVIIWFHLVVGVVHYKSNRVGSRLDDNVVFFSLFVHKANTDLISVAGFFIVMRYTERLYLWCREQQQQEKKDGW